MFDPLIVRGKYDWTSFSLTIAADIVDFNETKPIKTFNTKDISRRYSPSISTEYYKFDVHNNSFIISFLFVYVLIYREPPKFKKTHTHKSKNKLIVTSNKEKNIILRIFHPRCSRRELISGCKNYI